MIFSLKNPLKRGDRDGAIPLRSQSQLLPVNQHTKHKNEKGTLSKLKTFRSTSGAKYGLIIGDEGAILIYMVGKMVQSRNFIASASSDNLKEFEAILSKDIKAPIFLVIDSMDQSFIQQSLPPISTLGVKKLIKRRLDRDLGADVIKGYVLLERDTTGRRDWNFLMVSLENSPHLNLWFEFIEKVDNRLQGIYLLSVEAEYVVKHIDIAMGLPKKNNKNSDGSKWKFFITHNKVGGFRQVILRDGRIIFTRLTQPVGEVTAEVIAGNIEQEMTSTVEYMKRLSFNPQQGLDIYIIASAEINNSLDISKIPAKHTYKFTPFEIAEFFGITGAAQPSDQFGDVIMTACIACSLTTHRFVLFRKAHRLVLSLPKMVKINQLYSMIYYQRAIAGLASLVMIGYSGIVGLDVLNKYSEIENLEQKKIIQQRKLDEINTEIKKSGVDVRKVSDAVALYKQLSNETVSPLVILAALRSAIIAPVVIRDVLWEVVNTQNAAADGEDIETISLVLRFPEISNTDEAFSSVARKVLKDVRAAFPEYKVVYTKLPDALSKKSEAGEIAFDDKDSLIKLDKSSMEATLSLTKQPADHALIPGIPGSGTVPAISTDEIIGLGKQ